MTLLDTQFGYGNITSARERSRSCPVIHGSVCRNRTGTDVDARKPRNTQKTVGGNSPKR